MRKDQYLRFFRGQVKAMGHTSLSTLSNAEKKQLSETLQICVSAKSASAKTTKEVRDLLYELSTKKFPNDYLERRLSDIANFLGGDVARISIKDLTLKLKALNRRLIATNTPIIQRKLKVEISDVSEQLFNSVYAIITKAGIDDSSNNVAKMLKIIVEKLS